MNGATIYIHDIGNVRDGFPPQTNIVRVDGQRASLITILKTGNASTLDIISNVRKQLPLIAAQIATQLPPSNAPDPFHRRSIDLRQICHQRSCARGGPRRLSHRSHDPDISR